MEGLLILVAVYVLDIIIKKVAAGKKNKQEESRPIPREQPQEDFEDYPEDDESPKPSRSLQDLIRQFEESQREASQGTLVPPTPPVEDLPDEYEEDFDQVDLPVVPLSNPNRITFREIALSVIQWEEVSIEYLQQAFGFSEATAAQVLVELQAHHIVGRDMGEGFCDLLVHDRTELENLFKREQKEAEERKAAEAQEAALNARREAESKHLQELKELEERARLAREQAGQMSALPPVEETDGNSTVENSIASSLLESNRKIRKRSFDRAEIRRGFVWAKVLDEPRFKKRWSSRIR